MKKTQDNSFFRRHKFKFLGSLTSSLIAFIAFVIIYDVIPTIQYINTLWIEVTDSRVSASRAKDLCDSYKDASDREKQQNDFKGLLKECRQFWEKDMRKLQGLANQQHKQGKEIHKKIAEFTQWNWKQINYIKRYNSCSPELLSNEQLQYLEMSTLEPFPNSLLSYIRFYLNIISLWKFEGYSLDNQHKLPPR